MSIAPSYPWLSGDRLLAQKLDEAIGQALTLAADAKTTAIIASGTANGAVNSVNAYKAKSQPVSITIPFPPGFVVTDGTYLLSGYVPYDFAATGVAASIGTAGGSLDVAFRHDGLLMGTLGTITVTQQARTLFTAAGSNLNVPAGAVLDVVLAVTGQPLNGYLTLIGVRT